MALTLTKSELRATFAKMRVHMEEGYEEEEIAGFLGFDWSDWEELKRQFYQHEASVLQDKTTEQVYVDYILHKGRDIHDLTQVMRTFDKTKQPSAIVAAIKARSDIYDKIIVRGQEFGFIEKKPETKLVAGVLVAQLTDKDLRSAITGQLSQLDSLMAQFGDGSNIIDVEAGPTHLPTPKRKALPPAGKVKAHARNAVHGGRRVVKGKKAK